MKKSITFLITLFISIVCIAQEKKLLTVGDPVPEIQYSKWIKGTPFKPNQKNIVYVYEFWATWCGPCISAMPHLSDLAKKYKGKAQFVGVNVWEKIKDRPYESAIPAVEEFVKANGKRMDYSVIMDNNAQHMVNNWLIAAGEQGIPSTIVTKNGIVQWIGHPIELDGPLDSLVNGTFDLAAFKKRFAKRQQATSQKNAIMDRIFKAVKDAADAGDFDQLTKSIEDGAKEVPYLKEALQCRMFEALLKKRTSEEAFNYAEGMLKEFPRFKLTLALIVIDQNNLDKESYLKAIEWLKSSPKNSWILDKIADGYVKIGDHKSAITVMEEAVVKGQEELKDENYKERVFEYMVEGYKTKIQALKKEL